MSLDIKKWLKRYGLLIVVVMLYIVFSVIEIRFFTIRNLFSILRQASIMGILGIGLTVVISSGEFDLSFSANGAFIGVLIIYLFQCGWSLLPAVIAAILVGIFIELINAFNVIKIGVPSFIATLGMMGVITGVAKWLTGGGMIYSTSYPKGFDVIGRGFLFNIIPTPVVWFILVSIVFVLFLEYSKWGRYIYAIGSNEEAAKHAGINDKKLKWVVFIIMGFLSGLAGLVMASNFGSGNPVLGQSYLLPVIIIAFLGSVFLKEGIPNVWGAFVAALVLAILRNGFNMVGIPFYMKEIAQGIVLLAAVIFVVISGARDMEIGI